MAFPMKACMAAVILVLSAPAAAAGETVTEPDAIRMFLESSPETRRVPVAVRAADAAARVDSRVANPEVEYLIEDAAGVRDQFLFFRQELPITGRRNLVRDGASAASSSAGLAAERDLDVAVADLRVAFHEVLYRESVARRMRDAVERFDRVVEILAAREREGEGSGYDLLRADEERAAVAMATARAEAELGAARARFGAFFAPDLGMATARLVGTLQPSGDPPDPDEAIARALSHRRDLTAMREDARYLDLSHRAARRNRFPEPTLVAGWKRTELLGLQDTGFIAALTVPIPAFSRGQDAAARTAAERERVELDAEILERRIRADVRAAVIRETAAKDAAARYGGDVDRRAAELRRIAEVAYAEGESGILELLDAYRMSLAAELRALAVQYEARRAEIDRGRAVGDEVTR